MKNLKNLFPQLLLILSCASCGKERPTATHYYNQSTQLAERGHTQEAILYLDKAIKRKSKPHYLALKGTLLYQQHDFEKSKNVFELCLKNKNLEPHLAADITNNYACSLNQVGQQRQADMLWKELIHNSHYQTPEVAWFNLGLRAWGDYGILRQKPNSKKASAALQVALKRLDKALTIEPNYVDALFFKAQIYHTQKKVKKTKESLNKILELSPQHPGATQLLKRIT